MTFLVLFTIAAYYNLHIYQTDVKNIVLHGFFDQLIYIKMPNDKKTRVSRDIICNLQKAQYGLKQLSKL